jgi:hypothetical protein
MQASLYAVRTASSIVESYVFFMSRANIVINPNWKAPKISGSFHQSITYLPRNTLSIAKHAGNEPGRVWRLFLG